MVLEFHCLHEVFLEGNKKYRLSLGKGTEWSPSHKTKISNIFIINIKDVICFVKLNSVSFLSMLWCIKVSFSILSYSVS